MNHTVEDRYIYIYLYSIIISYFSKLLDGETGAASRLIGEANRHEVVVVELNGALHARVAVTKRLRDVAQHHARLDEVVE